MSISYILYIHYYHLDADWVFITILACIYYMNYYLHFYHDIMLLNFITVRQSRIARMNNTCTHGRMFRIMGYTISTRSVAYFNKIT